VTAPTAATRRRDLLAVALAAGTGSLDATAFLALGQVFVSVVTGNLVLVGLGAGRGDWGALLRVAVALIAYGAAIGVGTLVAGTPERAQSPWPRRATWCLSIELALLAGWAAGWELAGAHPRGGTQVALLGVAAGAMGLQSAAVRRLDLPGFSSTYLTSTYIALITDLVRRRRARNLPQAAALASLVLGAAAGGVLVTYAPRVAPAPVLAVVTLVVVAGRRLR
jgi:uncharacterized membrane protein YoaK (UPF0700 family)